MRNRRRVFYDRKVVLYARRFEILRTKPTTKLTVVERTDSCYCTSEVIINRSRGYARRPTGISRRVSVGRSSDYRRHARKIKPTTDGRRIPVPIRIQTKRSERSVRRFGNPPISSRVIGAKLPTGPRLFNRPARRRVRSGTRRPWTATTGNTSGSLGYIYIYFGEIGNFCFGIWCSEKPETGNSA